MTSDEALFKYCLRIGDSCLILGQRMAEWCSKGPTLEEDIALSNIGLDLFGQAKALLTYAATVEGKNQTEDDLAFKRNEREFFNSLLSERPNDDFGYTIVRNFLHETFFFHFYEKLQHSKNDTLSAHAIKSLKEIKYHIRHCGEWIIRLGDGTDESHDRVQNAINDLWEYTGDLFDMNEVDHQLIAENIAVDLSEIKQDWLKTVSDVFSRATLAVPSNTYMHTGSLKGIHSEFLGHLLAEMQYLPRAYPDANW